MAITIVAYISTTTTNKKINDDRHYHHVTRCWVLVAAAEQR